MAADNWDPPDHERTFYRHVMTGDLGWMVRRDGKDCIRYDRPGQDYVRLFKAEDWLPEREHRPLTKLQLAQVAFEADKKLCFFIGRPELASRQYLNMSEQQRIAWSDLGPPDTGARLELYRAIMSVLAKYAGR